MERPPRQWGTSPGSRVGTSQRSPAPRCPCWERPGGNEGPAACLLACPGAAGVACLTMQGGVSPGPGPLFVRSPREELRSLHLTSTAEPTVDTAGMSPAGWRGGGCPSCVPPTCRPRARPPPTRAGCPAVPAPPPSSRGPAPVPCGRSWPLLHEPLSPAPVGPSGCGIFVAGILYSENFPSHWGSWHFLRANSGPRALRIGGRARAPGVRATPAQGVCCGTRTGTAALRQAGALGCRGEGAAALPRWPGGRGARRGVRHGAPHAPRLHRGGEGARGCGALCGRCRSAFRPGPRTEAPLSRGLPAWHGAMCQHLWRGRGPGPSSCAPEDGSVCSAGGGVGSGSPVSASPYPLRGREAVALPCGSRSLISGPCRDPRGLGVLGSWI